MPRLSVVEGRKKEIYADKESRSEKKHELWLKTFFRLLPEAEKSKDNLVKAVCAGVRCFSLRDHGRSVGEYLLDGTSHEHDVYKATEIAFSVHGLVLAMLAELSPAKIVELFPQQKLFAGGKYGCKDWYTSVSAVEKYGGSCSFAGDDAKTQHFLLEVNDHLLISYVISGIMLIDDMRKIQGEKSVLEEFFEQEGKKLPVYHMIDGKKGKIFVDENGRKVGDAKKQMPRWARIAMAKEKQEKKLR